MIPIILVTHGPFAKSIIESSEMLVGKSEKLEAISLCPNDSFEGFQEEIILKAEELDEGTGVLILVDVLGGSPYNAAAKSLFQGNIVCLTGLNLSLLLTALDQREYCDLKQLVTECKAAATANIVDVREFISVNAEGDDDDE